MRDKHGRRFYYLRLSITDKCNFQCQYCLPDGYQGQGKQRFLSAQQIVPLLSAFSQLGTQKIRITGGEPSLRKDLPQIIHLCAQTPGINKVAMTTNGYKLAEQAQVWRDAGLSQVNVSIDSLQPRDFALITGQDRLSAVLQGVDRALEVGLKVKVNVVLMKSFNHHALERFFAWIKTRGVTLRFIELMQTGNNPIFFAQQHLSAQSIKNQLLSQGWQPIAKSRDAGPAEEFCHPEYTGNMGVIMPYSSDFCASCNRLRVSALGKLHLCLFAERGFDLTPWLDSGDVAGLQQQLLSLLPQKDVSHWLHQGQTGATEQLAMLGG